MSLRAESVSFAYGQRPIIVDVSFEAIEGELLGLVGPNGAGKSTLLRCLHGALRPWSGRVSIDERDLASSSHREIALTVAVVPQSCTPTFPVSVEEFVRMGRYARERFVAGDAATHRAAARRCLEELGLVDLAPRPIDELSGGEFRRVLVAQALAQEPRILLLDEPVAQLDLLHALEVMEFARAFTRRPGRAAVVVLHDLDLAARFCDRIAVLERGRLVVLGTPEEALTESTLSAVYGVNVAVQRCAATGALQVVPLRPSDVTR